MPVAVLILWCCDLYAQPVIQTTLAGVVEPASPTWNLASSICTSSDSGLRSIAVPTLNTRSSSTHPKVFVSCPCLSWELLVPIKWSGETISDDGYTGKPSDYGDDASESVPRRWLR